MTRISFYILILFCAIMTYAAPNYLRFDESAVDEDTGSNAVTAFEPADGLCVPLLFPAQKAFLQMPHDQRVKDYADWQIRKTFAQDGQKPRMVMLRWPAVAPMAIGDGTSVVCASYRVAIAENADMTDAFVVDNIPASQNWLELHNLKIATAYYWTMTAKTDKGIEFGASPILSFTTEDVAPRLMDFDSISNARDLGGRIGLDGRRVRQGLLYRSTAFNAPAAPSALTIEDAIAIHPEFKVVVEDYNQRKAALEIALEHADDSLPSIPCTISNQWLMFCPDMASADRTQIQNFLKLTAIPESYLNALPKTVVADENHAVTVSHIAWNRPAFFAQEFEVKSNGTMQIGFGCDWYGAFAIDGKIIADFSSTELGNQVKPIDTNSHIFAVTLTAGKHIVTAYTGAGLDGWMFCLGEPEIAIDHETALREQLACLEKEFKCNIPKTTGAIKAGQDWTTPKSRYYLNHMLGLKTDLDLRSEKECLFMTKSPLGSRIFWFREHYCAYQNIDSESGRNSFAKIFPILLNPDNYPMDCHCWGGQDRTGTLAYILNGLLGVDDEELWLDWEATCFYNADTGFRHEFTFNKMMDTFAKFPGETTCEKCEWYVKSCGFTDDDINAFREIMLENQ